MAENDLVGSGEDVQGKQNAKCEGSIHHLHTNLAKPTPKDDHRYFRERSNARGNATTIIPFIMCSGAGRVDVPLCPAQEKIKYLLR